VSHGVVRPNGRGSSVVRTSFIVSVDVLGIANYIFGITTFFLILYIEPTNAQF